MRASPLAQQPSPSDADARIGSALDGKYEIVRLLGTGGMGCVYEARHLLIGRRVAIKFVLGEFARHPEILLRFENEARAAGRLEHENIAAVLDFGAGADDGRYLVMEFLQGEDCEQLLTREGPLPVNRALDIVVQACRGLAVAHHAGIVHRDLKPANLFLTRHGDRTELVKLLDFGIAKLTADGSGATVTGLAMGTAHYMSPEQARGDKCVDHRTDIYALGVILYELLSGTKPHSGESYLQIIYSVLNSQPTPVESLRPALPHGLPELIARAMSPEPAARPSSVVEFGAALSQYLGRLSPTVTQSPSPLIVALDDTVASPRPSLELTPQLVDETFAPITPKTRAPIDTPRFAVSPARRIAIGAVISVFVAGTLAIVGWRAWQPAQLVDARSRPSAGQSAASLPLALPNPASSPSSEPSVVVLEDVLAEAGTDARPSATGRERPMGRVATTGKRGPGGPDKPIGPPASAASAAPAVTPSATPSTPAGARTVDIDREPNF